MTRVAETVIRLSLPQVHDMNLLQLQSDLQLFQHPSLASEAKTELIWMYLSAWAKENSKSLIFTFLNVFSWLKSETNQADRIALAVLLLMKGCEMANIYRRRLLQKVELHLSSRRHWIAARLQKTKNIPKVYWIFPTSLCNSQKQNLVKK